MDDLRKVTVVSMAFLLLAVTCVGVGAAEEEDAAAAAASRMPIIDAAKRLFSLSTASDYSWILKVKTLLFQQVWPYISPTPNLDFRDEGSKEGATEKVKEAVVKSVDKGKATVEDSAKSAAEFAEDAVGKTVKKIKNTFSGEAGAAAEL